MELNQQTGRETSYLSLDEGVELLSIEFPTEKEADDFFGRLTDRTEMYGLPKRYLNCIDIIVNPKQKKDFYKTFKTDLSKEKILIYEVPFFHKFD